MKKISNLIYLALLVMLPGSALATATIDDYLKCMDPTIVGDVSKAGQPCTGTGGTDSSIAIYSVIDSVLDRLPFFLTALAFAAFLYSGAMYVFAMGDTNKMEAAKKNLTWATIGMLAMSLVFAVIQLIGFLASQPDTIRSFTGIRGLN